MSLLQYLSNIYVTLKGKEPSSWFSERGENALLDSLCYVQLTTALPGVLSGGGLS